MLLIRQKRIENDWTQGFVAQQVGLSVQAVSFIETGQRRPSFDVLQELELLFRLDYRQLFNLPCLPRKGRRVRTSSKSRPGNHKTAVNSDDSKKYQH